MRRTERDRIRRRAGGKVLTTSVPTRPSRGGQTLQRARKRPDAGAPGSAPGRATAPSAGGAGSRRPSPRARLSIHELPQTTSLSGRCQPPPALPLLCVVRQERYSGAPPLQPRLLPPSGRAGSARNPRNDAKQINRQTGSTWHLDIGSIRGSVFPLDLSTAKLANWQVHWQLRLHVHRNRTSVLGPPAGGPC